MANLRAAQLRFLALERIFFERHDFSTPREKSRTNKHINPTHNDVSCRENQKANQINEAKAIGENCSNEQERAGHERGPSQAQAPSKRQLTVGEKSNQPGRRSVEKAKHGPAQHQDRNHTNGSYRKQ